MHRAHLHPSADSIKTFVKANRVLVATWLFIGALFAMALAMFSFSLNWRIEHDTPLLHYVAWMIDTYGIAPYRDIFETSFPGTFLFHWLIGHMLGWSDRPFHQVDACLSLLMAAVTVRLLRPLGYATAISAALLFMLSYLKYGPSMSLQKDYVGLVFVVMATALAVDEIRLNRLVRIGVVGFLFGLAITIKPHLALGLLPVGSYLLRRQHAGAEGMSPSSWFRACLQTGCMLAIGALVPVEVMLLTLAKMGSLLAFIDIVVDYLPLHIHLSRYHMWLPKEEHWRFLLWEWLHFGRRPINLWLPAGICGFIIARRATQEQPRQRALVYLFAWLTAVYAIYPAFSGQFWVYHYMPFLYCIIVMSSLLFVPAEHVLHSYWRWYPLSMMLATVAVIVATLVTALQPSPDKGALLLGYGWHPPKEGLVDEMAGELKKRMRPGDTVQTLDWAGGGIHALLINHVHLATRFMYNYHFYHDFDNPIILRLRHEFVTSLNQTKPRFILDVKSTERVKGIGTTTEFPELTDFIARNYVVDVNKRDFTLYERK